MLVEEGFNMVSVDASDKMLKYALKSRWERRKEPAFDKWGETFSIFTIFSLYMSDRLPISSGDILTVFLFMFYSFALLSPPALSG